MAERKTGPVKPPVIDLRAREAAPEGAKPEGEDVPSAGKPAGGASAATGARGAGAARQEEQPAPETGPSKEAEPQATAAAAAPDEAKASAQPAAEAPPRPDPARGSGAPPPRPPARLAMPWSAIIVAAVGGAMLGAGLVYLLASWIALPAAPLPFADPAPQLRALDERAAGMEAQLAELQESAADTRQSLDATIEQLDSGLAGLRRAIETLRQEVPEPTTVDLSGIEAELQRLESRLDATAAGASSADAAALAESIAGIERSVAALSNGMAAVEERLTATDGVIAALEERVSSLSTSLRAQGTAFAGAEIGPAVRLPLVVSALESAFVTGRSFASELGTLTTLLPELEVPAPLAEVADTGLVRPDLLARRFHEQVPDILAARTGAPSGDWAGDAVEWAKALLAFRPAGEIEGDTPEAVVSRLEAAVEREDFVAADGLLTSLPAPMRAAAGAVGDEIRRHAEAQRFVAGLRSQALGPAEAPASPEALSPPRATP